MEQETPEKEVGSYTSDDETPEPYGPDVESPQTYVPEEEIIEELPPEWENLDHIPDLAERPDVEEQLDFQQQPVLNEPSDRYETSEEQHQVPTGGEMLPDIEEQLYIEHQSFLDEPIIRNEPGEENLFSLYTADAGTGDTEQVEDPFVPIPYSPMSTGESIRRSGLAWSAGIAFFGSVAFTLFLGWLADLLFGSSPWGIIGGIILGSVVGFVQFFRITSRIYPEKHDVPKAHPIMLPRDDE